MAYIVLICILFAALVYDFRTYKIPNKIIIVGWIAGFVFRYIQDSYRGSVAWVSSTSCMIVILYLLYYISVMGAGDIKLCSVIGGFLGIKKSLILLAVTFLTAAFVSMILMIKRRNFRHRFRYLIDFLQRLKFHQEVQYMDFNNKDKAACLHFTLPLLMSVLILWGLEIFGWDFCIFLL